MRLVSLRHAAAGDGQVASRPHVEVPIDVPDRGACRDDVPLRNRLRPLAPGSDRTGRPGAACRSCPPKTVCGLPIPEPARQPPADSKPVVYLVVPCFEKQGGSSVVEAQTYLYYMEVKQQRQRALDQPLGALRRQDRADHPRRLQAPVGHQLPRRPLDRRPGLQVRQRRHRQDGRLQHGRAPARQDRRLRRLEEGREVEDRRGAEEAATSRSRSTRSSTRALSARSPASSASMYAREGLRVRRGQARDQAGQRGRPRPSTSPSTSPKDPRSRSGSSTSRATRRSPTASSAAR